MTRNNVRKVLGQTAQLANNICGKQNLLHSFPVGTTKLSSSNNNYSTKAKKENFINIPKQLHNNNKLMNIFVPDFKNYSSSSVNSNNNTIHVLNPVQYKTWSKDEVCSLLCAPEGNGGAGLTIEKVKPLYDVGFDGTSLGNIVTCIQDKDKYFATGDTCNSFPTIAPDTLKTVVFWVDNLLKTRLYHLWSVNELQSQLDEIIGFSSNSSQSLIENGFNKAYINAIILEKDDSLLLQKIHQDMKTDIKASKIILNWINSLILQPITAVSFTSSLQSSRYVERLKGSRVFGPIDIKPVWKTTDGETHYAPFVDRHEAILETIETLYRPELNSKPRLTLVSTSMGMGKSSFLCFSIKHFLENYHLMEQFIFGSTSSDNNIQKHLDNSANWDHYNRADFVNKLNIAYSIGHFIPFECSRLDSLNVRDLFYRMTMEHMKHLFEGVEIILQKGKNPVYISSVDQLIQKGYTEHNLLLRFSELIKLNAPQVQDLFTIPMKEGIKTSQPLPLILLVDSFHHINVDTSNEGTLKKLGVGWFNLKMDMRIDCNVSVALVVAANSLPNQFISEDRTFFSIKVVNLDLLFGPKIFNEITRDLFNAYLHSSVMNELGDEDYTTSPELQLSPYLSRIIVSILLLCSGNGRAIERFYENCGLEIKKLVQLELDTPLETRSTVIQKDARNALDKAKKSVSTFAQNYASSISISIPNTKYINLIKIMGVVMKPSTVIIDDPKATIEDLQKIGWFVKTNIDRNALEATYVGSFMLLNAFDDKKVVKELENLDQNETGEFKHESITYNDLLTPFKSIEQVKIQGDHFEHTIAGSIWARYYIACLESNVPIGSMLPIQKVLPIEMIPTDCLNAMTCLKGIVTLTKQFTSETPTSKLPSNRVIINLDQAKFCDVMLPIFEKGKQRFIGIQTRYIKTGGTQSKPFRFISSMKEVLNHSSGDFSFLFIATFIPKSLLDWQTIPRIKNKQYLEDNIAKFKFSNPTKLVSIWWHLLMYKHHPDKRDV